MLAEVYDVVVIGGGPSGENAADYAIRGSQRSALLIESGLLGGECSYYACMPSKALLRPLEVQATAEHLGGLPDRIAIDRNALLRRRDEWVSGYDDTAQATWAAGAGIDLARGRGRLIGPRRVRIDTSEGRHEVTARHAVVIATGSRPVIPEVFAGAHPWTSRDATGIVDIPDSIAVVGGGVVAAEAATWLAGLGAKVTMLVRGRRLLPRVEDFAASLVADALRDAGVDLRFAAEVDSVERDQPTDTGLGRIHGGPVRLTVAGVRLSFAEVLVATGRRAAIKDLGLDSVDLGPEQLADPQQRPDWLYVVGDASSQPQLTHWGKYAARLAGDRIAALAEGRPAPVVPPQVPVPQVVYTDPQVASVGLTSAEAAAAGRAVICAEADLASAAGVGLLRDDATGRARLVFAADSGRLLGATFAGTEVAELLHAATIAIVGRLSADQLWHAVPAYPTASEIWLRLLEDYRSRR